MNVEKQDKLSLSSTMSSNNSTDQINSLSKEQYPDPILLPVSPSDIPTLASITAAAITPDLYFRLRIPSIASFRLGVEKTLLADLHDPTWDFRFMKAVSPNNEIMGYISVKILPKDHDTNDARHVASVGDRVEVHEFPARDGLLESVMEKQNTILEKWVKGHRTLGINGLYTHPEFQRRGVGTALMKWANSLADEYGILSFLEATPAGRKLYGEVGYHEVDFQDLDLREWAIPGGEGFGWGVYRLTFMLRLAEG